MRPDVSVRVPRHLECARGIVGGVDMRTALVAASALAVALAGQAAAADLPVAPAYRAAPIVVPYNWNGYYIGANVGWSRAQSNVSFAANPAGFPADAASINTASQNRLTSNSVTGGAQTGYNWQWSNLVAGVEADVSFLNNNAQLPAVPLPAPSAPGIRFRNGAAFVAGDSRARARLRVGQLARLRHRRLGVRQGHVHRRSRSRSGRPDRNDDRPGQERLDSRRRCRVRDRWAGGARSSNTCTSISAR